MKDSASVLEWYLNAKPYPLGGVHVEVIEGNVTTVKAGSVNSTRCIHHIYPYASNKQKTNNMNGETSHFSPKGLD